MSLLILSGPLKRSIMARISSLDLDNPDDLSDTVQVAATLPPEPERKVVYGGRTTWVQRDVLAERNVAYEQAITFEVRVRVVEPGDDVDAVEKEAERIVSTIASGVVALPDLTGGRGRIIPQSGDADPTIITPAPEPETIANVSVVFLVTLSVMGG